MPASAAFSTIAFPSSVRRPTQETSVFPDNAGKSPKGGDDAEQNSTLADDIISSQNAGTRRLISRVPHVGELACTCLNIYDKPSFTNWVTASGDRLTRWSPPADPSGLNCSLRTPNTTGSASEFKVSFCNSGWDADIEDPNSFKRFN
eukprot:CAMPEP_0194502442 /NCGR_PEP_ID=MMETSP0253-20130528/25741_1 /TAXON_ID=2966 /ORGANISM="Noctiluca scintillans" /LENGTH=146 /DNA_ID=CAMNT_0039344595 /DNA_START=60 /DNA_END=500 /DNA_ORIENTATION=+